MEVKIFLTADFANVDRAGKLNVLGAFTEIQTNKLPVMLMQLFVVVQLEFDYNESEAHRIVYITLYNPDGVELATMPSEFNVPKISYGRTAQMNVLAGIQRILFEEIGTYEFKLFMGDNYVSSVSIDVKDFRESTRQKSGG